MPIPAAQYLRMSTEHQQYSMKINRLRSNSVLTSRTRNRQMKVTRPRLGLEMAFR